MSMFYCFTCDRYRDSNEEDNADYSGEEIVCGDCVQERDDEREQLSKFISGWYSFYMRSTGGVL